MRIRNQKDFYKEKSYKCNINMLHYSGSGTRMHTSLFEHGLPLCTVVAGILENILGRGGNLNPSTTAIRNYFVLQIFWFGR